MKQWMGTRRFVYNRVLSKVKSGEETKINFYALRNKYVTAKNNPSIERWQLDTPKDIRAGALRDMVKNHKTAFSQLRSKNISHFKMNYCSKKDAPSIEIPKTALKFDGGFFMYNSYMKTKINVGKRQKKIKLDIDYDCRLQCKNNEWWLLIPIKTKVKEVRKRKEWCSLDPGVRSFQTIYSEDMVVQVKIKKELVKKLQTKIDLFRSMRDRKIIKRKRYTRKERKIYSRMNNLIDELHHQTINFLTTTYNHIILPIFESQKMTKHSNNRYLNRSLLQLKHFLFQQRLKAKCLLRQCTLDICTEEYTSKTCGGCGVLNDVGCSEIYTCSKCNLIVDRDVNGARNIGIKRLNETL